MGPSAGGNSSGLSQRNPRQGSSGEEATSLSTDSEAVINRELSLSEWALKPEKEEDPVSLAEAPSTSGEIDLKGKRQDSWWQVIGAFIARSNRKKRELRKKLHQEGFLRIAEDTLSLWQKLWHYVLVDPYERVNVWSHALGALFFVCCAIWGSVGWLFPLCAAATHLLSVGAHIYPGNLLTEKLDHLGIVCLIVGTPLSVDEAFGWTLRGDAYAKYIIPAIGLAAILPDEPRVCGFIGGAIALLGIYQNLLLEVVMLAELALYLSVGYLFLKNGNHHRSKWALADHHIAHYCVTAASLLHTFWLRHLHEASSPLLSQGSSS